MTDRLAPSALVAINGEPPARLIVSPPLAEPLSQGRVLIRYGADNLRVIPVYGEAALAVSPRVGHVHVTVDDAPWHFVDASGETIVLVGLAPGEHRVSIELADPVHRVIDRADVRFRVPEHTDASHPQQR